jgi:hypothetical protein
VIGTYSFYSDRETLGKHAEMVETILTVRQIIRLNQDDQIGRIFANPAIFYFGLFIKMTEIAQFFGRFFHCDSYALILRNIYLGLHFGYLFHKRIWSPWS